MHKALVFLFGTPTGLGGFSSPIFLSDFNDLSVFFLSFLTGLGGFSSINLFGFLPQHYHWVRRFFINDFSIYDFVNDLSVFFLSFPTGLGGFSLIDLAGFLPQFFHWVRRFFIKLPITMTTRLTELTSKREGNWNGLVTRPNHKTRACDPDYMSIVT